MIKNSRIKRRKYKKLRRFYKPSNFLTISLVVALASVLWWSYITFYEPSHLLKPSTYNNLDLSIAGSVSYTNRPINQIRNLGLKHNVRHELISFNVPDDGLTEFALMTLPNTNDQNKKYPVIILCHGYSKPSGYSTTGAYLSDMEFYSQHGFVVIKPDYRGQGLSLTSGSPEGAYYSMAYNTDVMSLIAAVRSTSSLDKSNINLWGHSMGGYIALRAAVLSKDIKNVILLSAPVGTVHDMYADYDAISDRANPKAAEIREEQTKIHGTPLSNPNFWGKTSPLNYLAHSKTYFQIHVGTDDKIVPPVFSADLNNALNEAHVGHAYYVYPGGTHGLRAQKQVIWKRSLAVLEKS